ncbi:MAG: hypothetical protein ACOYL7_09070, partial [Caldilinea sp.]
MKSSVGRGSPPLWRPAAVLISALWIAIVRIAVVWIAVVWIAAGCSWLSGPLPPWHAPRLAPLLTAPPGLSPPFS